MKIAVIGMGAMGSFYASKLSLSNQVVGLDHNKEKIDLINKEGMNILYKGKKTNFKFKCFLLSEYKEIQDLVVIFVKSTQTIDALKSASGIIGKNTLVLTLQNGLGNAEDLLNFVSKDNIILGNTRTNCVKKGLNLVECSEEGVTNIGSFVENDLHEKEVLQAFISSNFDCKIRKDIKHMIWYKLAINAGTNALSAIFKCSLFDIHNNKYIWNMCVNLIKETSDVAKFKNVDIDAKAIIDDYASKSDKLKNGYVSMYQDVMSKRKTEIDKINGAVLKIAKENNYDVRYTEFVVKAVKAIELQY